MNHAKYPLRAFIVCVEYVDLLAVTLPYNAHHFDEVNVVTRAEDVEPLKRLLELIPWTNRIAGTHCTDAFYRNGAHFNKWLALEEALDQFGRHGWICLMDADVVWPKTIHLDLVVGRLTSPLRRMMPLTNPTRLYTHAPHTFSFFPREDQWWQFPIHRNINEWAGYSQIFHGNDPVLGKGPWHETNWRHAGGADSFFQARWPLIQRVRPTWECLHLGEAGQNWCGRTTPFLDGTIHPKAMERSITLSDFWKERRQVVGPDKYDREKLK